MAAELTVERPLRLWLMARDERLDGAVYPGFAVPGQTETYLTYRRVSAEAWGHLRGRAGVSRARLELNVWSKDHAEARSVADKVAGTTADPGLDRFRGDMAGTRVQYAARLDEGDDPEPAADGSEDVWFRVRCDYTIVWEEGD